jgi:hypothetical protein
MRDKDLIYVLLKLHFIGRYVRSHLYSNGIYIHNLRSMVEGRDFRFGIPFRFGVSSAFAATRCVGASVLATIDLILRRQ